MNMKNECVADFMHPFSASTPRNLSNPSPDVTAEEVNETQGSLRLVLRMISLMPSYHKSSRRKNPRECDHNAHL